MRLRRGDAGQSRDASVLAAGFRRTTSTVPPMQRLCVFLASSTGANPANTEATVALGTELVERGIGLVYGGGAVGLMGVLADTVMDGGGEVIGVIPRNLFAREVAHQGLTRLIETDSMHERRAQMYERSDAFAALPGGLGTLEELAEIATWRQIGMHTKTGRRRGRRRLLHLAVRLDGPRNGRWAHQRRQPLHYPVSADTGSAY